MPVQKKVWKLIVCALYIYNMLAEKKKKKRTNLPGTTDDKNI